jgi:hypothetical protein
VTWAACSHRVCSRRGGRAVEVARSQQRLHDRVALVPPHLATWLLSTLDWQQPTLALEYFPKWRICTHAQGLLMGGTAE